MSNAANIQLLLESLEALNARDADRFMATIHEDVTWSLDATKDPISGPEALRTVVEAMIASIPDMHYELVQILGAGNDHVVIRYVLTGTHGGDFMGIAPSQNKIAMHGCV